jgi:hypothetical protein
LIVGEHNSGIRTAAISSLALWERVRVRGERVAEQGTARPG